MGCFCNLSPVIRQAMAMSSGTDSKTSACIVVCMVVGFTLQGCVMPWECAEMVFPGGKVQQGNGDGVVVCDVSGQIYKGPSIMCHPDGASDLLVWKKKGAKDPTGISQYAWKNVEKS